MPSLPVTPLALPTAVPLHLTLPTPPAAGRRPRLPCPTLGTRLHQPLVVREVVVVVRLGRACSGRGWRVRATSTGGCCPVLGRSPTTAPRPVLGRVVVLMDMVRGVGVVRGAVRVMLATVLVVMLVVMLLVMVLVVMVLGASPVAGGCANWGAARTCRDCNTK